MLSLVRGLQLSVSAAMIGSLTCTGHDVSALASGTSIAALPQSARTCANLAVKGRINEACGQSK